MTTAKQMAKFQKALKEAAEIFDDIDISSVRVPAESVVDLIREAASVIAYFDMREKFREEICRACGLKFAYAYYTTSVKHCSIPCLKDTLEALGLPWSPDKPFAERWGGRFVPAIVPAPAYAIIQEQAPPVEEARPEPVKELSNETQSLIESLTRLSGEK